MIILRIADGADVDDEEDEPASGAGAVGADEDEEDPSPWLASGAGTNKVDI